MRRPLMAVFAVVLCSWGCRANKPTALFIDPALEKLIPADATFIAGANLDRLRATPVFQKYLPLVNLPQLEDFVQKTGLDPRKDLSQVLSTSNGRTPLFLARGKFVVGDLEPKLAQNGLTRSDYQGHHLFGDERQAVMFLSSSVAVAGPPGELKSILDSGGKSGRGLPPALRELIVNLGSDRQIWAAFVGGLRSLNIGVPDDSNLGQVIHAFRGIEQGTLGMDLRNGIDLRSDLSCHDDNGAKHVHDALRGILGIGRLSTPDNRPDLLQLYDAVKVVQDHTKVNITAQVSPELEDKFLNLWLKRK